MIFRQLFDAETSTYTYLLGDAETKQALLIDPVIEQAERDAQYIRDLGLSLTYILDTHVHADHITAASRLKKHFPEALYLLGEKSRLTCADRLLHDGETVTMGEVKITSWETPGHTDNSVSYFVDDMIFTGDALLIRGCGRTDFQSGDNHALWTAIHEKIFSMPDATYIYPGHDYKGFTVSTVGEEKRLNPRLGTSTTEEEFANIINTLNLPYPRKIDASLPANMQCGEVPEGYEREPAMQG